MPTTTMYTLQDAAAELQVDVKTLGRWLDRIGMEPVPDQADRRKRLLSAEQVERLRYLYRPSEPEAMEDDDSDAVLTDLEGLRAAVENMQEAINGVSAQLGSLQTSVVSLHSWVAAAMDTMATQMARTAELAETQRILSSKLARLLPPGADE